MSRLELLQDDALPLSSAQLGIWFAQNTASSSVAYNIGEYIEVRGTVNPHLFERALRQVVLETESLRVQLVEHSDGVRQIVGALPPWSVTTIDVSAETDARGAAELWMKADLDRPIDLIRGPLFGFALFRVSDNCFFWYARYHHIVMDCFGMSLLAQRLAEVYSDLVNGRPFSDCSFGSLATLIEQDIAYLSSEKFNRDRQYWLKQLTNQAETISLGKPPAKFGSSSNFLRRSTYLNPLSLTRLNSIAQKAGTSLARVITAVTAIFMHRMTGAEDSILSLPVAARNSHVRHIPGMAANMLPLRLTVHRSLTLLDVVRQTALQISELREHQHCPLADLRRDAGQLVGDLPLWGPAVNFMRFNYNLSFAGHKGTAYNLSYGPVEDLTVAIYDRLDGRPLRIDFDANSALYVFSELEDYQRRFLRLLDAAIAEPDRPIGSLELLSPAERRIILEEWNATARAITSATVPELFAAQAAKTPAAVAVVFAEESLSYAELDAGANQLAHHLRALGVGPEVVVGLCLERSPAMIIALLGILKAGGAYLPLDPGYPTERLAFMLDDARAPVLVTHSALRDRMPVHPARTVCLDADASTIARRPITAPIIDLLPQHPAYVIYTSGSTGTPKGVVIAHRASLANKTRRRVRDLQVGRRSMCWSSPSIAFDFGHRANSAAADRRAALLVIIRDSIRDVPEQFWRQMHPR